MIEKKPHLAAADKHKWNPSKPTPKSPDQDHIFLAEGRLLLHMEYCRRMGYPMNASAADFLWDEEG